jgi:hypothetical protein
LKEGRELIERSRKVKREEEEVVEERRKELYCSCRSRSRSRSRREEGRGPYIEKYRESGVS